MLRQRVAIAAAAAGSRPEVAAAVVGNKEPKVAAAPGSSLHRATLIQQLALVAVAVEAWTGTFQGENSAMKEAKPRSNLAFVRANQERPFPFAVGAAFGNKRTAILASTSQTALALGG